MQDLVKLRLRGKGSGFKEGPNHQESNDPLHLCISSKYSEIYDKACELTENLIDGIYTQYYRFEMNKYGQANRLQMKKIENIFGRRSSGSSNDSANNEYSKNSTKNTSFRKVVHSESNFIQSDDYMDYQNQTNETYGYYDSNEAHGPLNFSKGNPYMRGQSFKNHKDRNKQAVYKGSNRHSSSSQMTKFKSRTHGT